MHVFRTYVRNHIVEIKWISLGFPSDLTSVSWYTCCTITIHKAIKTWGENTNDMTINCQNVPNIKLRSPFILHHFGIPCAAADNINVSCLHMFDYKIRYAVQGNLLTYIIRLGLWDILLEYKGGKIRYVLNIRSSCGCVKKWSI